MPNQVSIDCSGAPVLAESAEEQSPVDGGFVGDTVELPIRSVREPYIPNKVPGEIVVNGVAPDWNTTRQ